MAVAVALSAVLIVPAVYAVLRANDVLFNKEPNPTTLMFSLRIAMFWRLGIGLYCAAMVVPIALLAARANLERTMRTLEVLVVVVAAMIAIQGVFLP